MARFSTKPVVWVSGPDKGGTAAWLATRYAVRRSGGRAMRVTPSNREKIRRKTFRRTGVDAPHALIIGGGADIDPVRYEDLITDLKNIRTTPDPREPKGQRWHTLVLGPFFTLLRWLFSAGPISVDQARDDLEWQLLEDAIGAGIPVLGICRGAQLINVFHKGTLYQDLATYYRERPTISTIYPRKEVRLDPQSRLFEILNGERIRVNSLHNQAVKDTGEGIVVVARELPGNNVAADDAGKIADNSENREGSSVSREGSSAIGTDSSEGTDSSSVEGADVKANSGHGGQAHGTGSSLQGVAQAIEHRDHHFMIGVQWHPEYLPQVHSQRRLFDELVRCAILHRSDNKRNQME